MLVARGWMLAVLVSVVELIPMGTAWSQNERVPTAGPEERPGWRFTFTPNAWASGVKGTVGNGSQLAEVAARTLALTE